MYQNILVPIDGSETAGRGLGEAIELSFGHSGCEPSRNLETAAFYWISAIAAEEPVEHLRRLR